MKIISAPFSRLISKLIPIQYARWKGVKIGKDCRLIEVEFGSEPYLVTLGDHVSATKAVFITHDGAVWLFREKHPKLDIVKPIYVGSNVFIGYGAIVMPGVVINDNVIVGAGAVVVGVLESGSVYAGVPARRICGIDEYYKKSLESGIETKGLSRKMKKRFLQQHFKR